MKFCLQKNTNARIILNAVQIILVLNAEIFLNAFIVNQKHKTVQPTARIINQPKSTTVGK
jgi:hypothetical protein